MAIENSGDLPSVTLGDLKALNKAIAAPQGSKKLGELAKLSELELRNLRVEVDNLLPVKALSDINMEFELVAQYKLAQALQNAVANDHEKGVSEKDKGTLLRLATATLESLIKLQGSTYTSERIKYVEVALLSAMEEVPIEVKKQFYEKYSTLLDENMKDPTIVTRVIENIR